MKYSLEIKQLFFISFFAPMRIFVLPMSESSQDTLLYTPVTGFVSLVSYQSGFTQKTEKRHLIYWTDLLKKI